VRGEKKVEPGALLVGLWPRGRRSQTARRRHAHPLGSARAGERVGDGAVIVSETEEEENRPGQI